MSSIYSIIAVVARIFSLKTRKKKKKPRTESEDVDENPHSPSLALSYLKLSTTADQDNEKCYLHLDEKLFDS